MTVSYIVSFIPGLPGSLALSEVVDDVMSLASFKARHTLRKLPGATDRLDIVVPVADVPDALGAAADAAGAITHTGESLLGLGFVLDARSVRIDGVENGWLSESFRGMRAAPDPALPRTPRPALRPALALFALAHVALLAPWGLGLTPVSIAGTALVAVALMGASVVVWTRRAPSRIAQGLLAAVAAFALVLAFTAAYAVAARDGDVRQPAPGAIPGSTVPGPRVTTFGRTAYASASLGAGRGIVLIDDGLYIAYVERLLVLAVLTGAVTLGGLGAMQAVRETRVARVSLDEVLRRTEPTARVGDQEWEA
jgi:hypothetical protein